MKKDNEPLEVIIGKCSYCSSTVLDSDKGNVIGKGVLYHGSCYELFLDTCAYSEPTDSLGNMLRPQAYEWEGVKQK